MIKLEYIYIVQYSLTPRFASSFKVYINRSIIIYNNKCYTYKYNEYIIHVNISLLSPFFFLDTAERKRVSSLFKFNILVFDFPLYIYIIFQYVTILGTLTG